MNSRVFFISDTHFGHKNIVEKFGRTHFSSIEEHDEFIVDKWNSQVNKRDSVIHLGDVCLGGKQNLGILDKLHGTKKLVLGNHDTYPAVEYLKYFAKLFGSLQYRRCILTHIPVHADQEARYRANIHGHTHEHNVKWNYGGVYLNDEDPWYFSVTCENLNYTPIPWDEINEILKEPGL